MVLVQTAFTFGSSWCSRLAFYKMDLVVIKDLLVLILSRGISIYCGIIMCGIITLGFMDKRVERNEAEEKMLGFYDYTVVLHIAQ